MNASVVDHLDELGEAMIRLGLCCIFRDEPIKFLTTTATAIGKMKRPDALAKLSRLCLANADALLDALRFCADNGIGCFRINSQILPIKTHPTCGYEVDDLPEGDEIARRFKACGKFVRKHNLRICFHPDQFVVLNSQRPVVVEASIRELEYQAEVAEWVGADVVNIHGGGAFGARQIVERFAPERIILFGSYAYGTPTPDSDVDLLVVMPTRNQIEQAVRIDEAIEERGFPLDLLVYTPKVLAQRLRLGDSLMQVIVSRGKVLYENDHAGMGST